MLYDYVIIGAGILGVSIAKELVKKFPQVSILLLDKSMAGMGASSFSAGLHIPYGVNEKIRSLSQVSADEYNKLIEDSGTNYPIYPINFSGLVSSEKYEDFASKFFNRSNTAQKNADLLPSSLGQVKLNAKQTIFSIRNTHYANVLGVVQCQMKDLSRANNLDIWEGAYVKEIYSEHQFVKITLIDERKITSKKVILAPGPWAINSPFSDTLKTLKLRSKKVVALHINKKPHPSDPGLFFFDHDAFLLPVHHRGHWLFSYTCQQWNVNPDSEDMVILKEDRKTALEILQRYCPELITYSNSGRVFCDVYSKDGMPIVTCLPEDQKIIYAGATNGSGYRLAPGIAQATVKICTSSNS